MSVVEFAYQLPRTAFSSREVARSGDVLRAFQDVAVEAASRRGWPPPRMREVGSVWIVRQVSVVHHRETSFGEPLTARSWVRRNRRGIFSTRELTLHAGDDPVASATQEWVHLSAEGPSRMPEAMERDLGTHAETGPTLPESTPVEGPEFRFDFEVWEGWMDPVGHVNHPQYVDFADENVLRVLRRAALDPVDLVPVADDVAYRKQLVAGDRAIVRSRVVGRTASGGVVIDHRIGTETDPNHAEIRSVRAIRRGDLAGALAQSANAGGPR